MTLTAIAIVVLGTIAVVLLVTLAVRHAAGAVQIYGKAPVAWLAGTSLLLLFVAATLAFITRHAR